MVLAGCLLAACSTTPSWHAPSRWKADGEPILPTAPGGWARFQIERRMPEGGEGFPMHALSRARAQIDTMARYSTRLGRLQDSPAAASGSPQQKAHGTDWEWLGPDNVAGRMRTLAFDPRDPGRLVAGGVSGGIWGSDDGGESWQLLSDDAANTNIGALVIDPVEPDTIYAGTGELYRNTERPYSAMWGQGILRSRDGGASFQQLLATANDDFRYVSDLVVSHHDHRRLYAATNSGVWRSDDRGNRWQRLLRPADDADRATYEGCTDLLLLPDDGHDVLLASCASRSTGDRYWLPNSVLPPACAGPCPAAVFRNPDAAGSGAWTTVLSEPGMGRTQMDFARSAPNVLYAASASIVPGFDRTGDGQGDYDNGLHAVFRSNDGGLTWHATLRNDDPDALSTYLFSYADGFQAPECGFGERFVYGAGWYNMAIAVDPTNAERLWVAGMEHYRSDDGGQSFGKASYWWYDGFDPRGVHADQHLLRFHPQYDGIGNRQLYSANDGGLAVTDDATAPTTRGATAACVPAGSAVTWRPLVAGMGTLQFYTGAVAADGSLWLGGSQDNGTQLNRAGSATNQWEHVFGGDGAFAAVDPRTADRLYVSAQYISLHRSDDGGANFTPATAGISDTPIFVMPYALDTAAPDRLWAGATRIWRTDNRGASWQPVSDTPGFTFDDRISAIAVAPTNSNRVLAGTRKAIRYNHSALSAAGTTHWSEVAPRKGWVSSLGFDPVDDDIAYATYSSFGGDHVWRSADGGVSWTPIDGSGAARLPDLPVHTLAIDPTDRQRLYVGTDMGVFVTNDGGAHWAVENAGFPNVIVEALRVAPGPDGVTPHLYAFTYGRGAWRVPLAGLDGVPEYRIDERISGSFYDPAQPGHGWLLEAIESDGVLQLVAAWYTWLDGEPRWLIGIGPVDRNTATIPLSTYAGGDFPPDFDPATLERSDWGSVELRFDSADAGTATWTSDAPGFGNGSMPLQRLTALAPAGGDEAGIRPCHSGSWYQPAQSGHGLMVEVLGPPGGRNLVAVWYAFLDGEQRWLIGSGPVDGDSAELAMVVYEGGQFPPAFDPAALEQHAWGTLRFTVQGNDAAHIEWSATQAGYGSGQLGLNRLTTVRGLDCGA